MKRSKPTATVANFSEEVKRLNPELAGMPRNAPVRPVAAFSGSGRVDTADKGGKGRRMNATESEFQLILKSKGYNPKYEGIRLKFAEDKNTGRATHYKADFFCRSIDSDPRPILFEVKGDHIYEKDLLRFRGCRGEWQDDYRFELHQKQKGVGWVRLE